VYDLQTRIQAIAETMRGVERAEGECAAANVEENDYTVFTYQDLEYEFELLQQGITKKIKFLDNQVCCAQVVISASPDGIADCFKKHDELDAGAAGAIREHFPVL
jgi:hypothetical protein